MTRRIECTAFPEWDGAEFVGMGARNELSIVALRPLPADQWRREELPAGTSGLIGRGEVAGLVGVAEDEDATLYRWSGVLRRWVPLANGPAHRLRGWLAEYRRTYPWSAYWIRPNREAPCQP